MKRKVTIKNIIGYASINFLGSGAQGLISLFLMIFYTSLCDLSATQVGIIFSVTRLIDAIGNPIMGFISDNFGKTRFGKRFGRRKFFILIGAPLCLLVFPLLWVTGQSYVYYFGINMIWEMIFTMIIVSAITLPAEMAQTAADKTKLVAAKSYLGTAANAIAALIPAGMFGIFGEKDPNAFLFTGIAYGIILAISLIVVYALTFERDPGDIVYNNEAHGMGQVLKKLWLDITSSLKVKTFRLHAIMMFTIGIYKNLAAGVFVYFVVFCLGLTKATTAYISGFSTVISIVSLTIFIAIAYKFGGPKTFRIAAVIVIGASAAFFGLTLMQGTSLLVPALVVISLINTIGKGGCDYIPVFQLPFMADIDEAVTGTRREGIFSGVNGLLSKLASAIEGLLIGIGLDAFGFVKGAETQPESAVTGILILTVIAPIVLLAITWVVSLRLKLTKENHKILVDEVDRVKAGGARSAVTAEARLAIEELTGYAYENCFGNNNVGYHSKTANA
jgi:oligogalacturonide transporter